MPLLTIHRSALLAVSIALAGCTTMPGSSARDATALSGPGSRVAPGARGSNPAETQPPLELEGAIRQAQTERRAGDLTGSAKTLSQLVLVAPDDSRVLGEYGKTLVAMGRSDDALAFLERAIQLQPSDWSLFSAQGVAFDQKGQYRQAQISYARALSLYPGEPTVLSNDALSHMQSGDLDGAEQLLLEAARAGGDYPRISSNLALVQSLKASRAAYDAARAKAVVQAPAPVETQTSNSGTPPTVAEPALTQAPEAPAAVLDAPVERIALPEGVPGDQPAFDVTNQETPLRPSGAEALAGNPTVRMQAVPKDDQAGPVAPVVRKRPVPKPTVVAKKAPDRNVTAEEQPQPQDPSDSFLRPALMEKTAAGE